MHTWVRGTLKSHVGLAQVLLILSVHVQPIGNASTGRLAKVVKLENLGISHSNRYFVHPSRIATASYLDPILFGLRV